MANLLLSDTAASHLAYHTRLAAIFATAGDLDECASEALLAWTILTVHGGGDVADSLIGDLPPFRSFDAGTTSDVAARRRAHALALELLGHFVSEGQTDSAALYEDVASALHQS
jgi:hypothetical protein